MLVQRVAMPARGMESWTVLGDGDVPIAPIERYLAYLTDIERSPNTVKAYAHDLKDYWTFLTFRGLDWREVRLEDLASTWRGCGCHRRVGTGRSRCCRRCARMSVRRRSTGSCPRWRRSTRTRCGTASMLATCW